ncbi:unnamed protein product [Ilex paraguariensis]|uniref:Uncharacterized protein n=1 Tax=Ilex paraguariensis TaxID=185542 RepID=A0ABC8V2C0_9AQUA
MHSASMPQEEVPSTGKEAKVLVPFTLELALEGAEVFVFSTEVLAHVVSFAPATSVTLAPIPTFASGITVLFVVPTDPTLIDSPEALVLTKLLTKVERERDELKEENDRLQAVNAHLEEKIYELKRRPGGA